MAGLSRTTPCRGCGKPIAFIKTKLGKAMPVNPESIKFVPAGGPNTYVLLDGSVARGRGVQYGDTETKIGYISHFATCQKRDDFKK